MEKHEQKESDVLKEEINDPRKDSIKEQEFYGHGQDIMGHKLKPETLMMGYGYTPKFSEYSLKPPIFLTSTFIFPSAEKGKRNFELTYGLSQKKPGEQVDLIYSRINNPNLEMLEDRISVWDGLDKSLVFASGMACISSFILGVTRPGDAIISSDPVYGGTHHLFNSLLPEFNIKTYFVIAGAPKADYEVAIQTAQKEGRKVRVLYVESPANPTIVLTDLKLFDELKKKYSTPDNKIIFAVDNTFLGPCFLKPRDFGADVVLYSATKFIGGHSDLIGGVLSTTKEVLPFINRVRSIFGTMGNPFDCWLMMRSLETIKIRMEKSAQSAIKIASFLESHPIIVKVTHPSLLKEGCEQYRIFKEQCKSSGSLISFDVKGGEKQAFRFLNALQLCRLAVSLGGTETLIQHPKSMTHSDVSHEECIKIGIYDNSIRISIGIEDVDDIIFDLRQALERVH